MSKWIAEQADKETVIKERAHIKEPDLPPYVDLVLPMPDGLPYKTITISRVDRRIADAIIEHWNAPRVDSK
jgi:hypothetical protein